MSSINRSRTTTSGFRMAHVSSSGTRVPVWLRYLCSTPGWGLGGVDAVWPATRVGEGSVFS